MRPDIPAAEAARSTCSTERLVRDHVPLVSHLVRETLTRVPGQVSADDLTSAGMLALLRAADAFGSLPDGAFTSYATTRIRAALVQQMRGLDWASRTARPAREPDAGGTEGVRPTGLEEAVADLPAELRAVVEGYFSAGRATAEIAAELGVSETRVQELRAEALTLLRGALATAAGPEDAMREGRLTASQSALYASVAAHRGHAARLPRLRGHHPGSRRSA